MSPKTFLAPILNNDHVTRGLGDAEARLLVEWLVDRAEALHAEGGSDERIERAVVVLCLRARALARFVYLWCYERSHAAACQLAATQRFTWPLPTEPMDPYDLMTDILAWESELHPEAEQVDAPDGPHGEL